MAAQSSYLYQKLAEASEALGPYSETLDSEGLTKVLLSLNAGIGIGAAESKHYVDDPRAAASLEVIRALITPTDDDSADPDKESLRMGAWHVRARRLSRDDLGKLSQAIHELLAHLHNWRP